MYYNCLEFNYMGIMVRSPNKNLKVNSYKERTITGSVIGFGLNALVICTASLLKYKCTCLYTYD